MEVKFGIKYEFLVWGEPQAKHTNKPPKGKGAFYIVQNSKNPDNARLARTWAYQRFVGECAIGHVPRFETNDPIHLSCHIMKAGRKRGDIKNIVAAIEDGLVWGGYIPDDSQVVSHSTTSRYGVGKDSAGVMVSLWLDESIKDPDWLEGWFGNKKQAEKYLANRGL